MKLSVMIRFGLVVAIMALWSGLATGAGGECGCTALGPEYQMDGGSCDTDGFFCWPNNCRVVFTYGCVSVGCDCVRAEIAIIPQVATCSDCSCAMTNDGNEEVFHIYYKCP